MAPSSRTSKQSIWPFSHAATRDMYLLRGFIDSALGRGKGTGVCAPTVTATETGSGPARREQTPHASQLIAFSSAASTTSSSSSHLSRRILASSCSTHLTTSACPAPLAASNAALSSSACSGTKPTPHPPFTSVRLKGPYSHLTRLRTAMCWFPVARSARGAPPGSLTHLLLVCCWEQVGRPLEEQLQSLELREPGLETAHTFLRHMRILASS